MCDVPKVMRLLWMLRYVLLFVGTLCSAQWSCAAVLLSRSAFLILVCWGTNTHAHAGEHKTQWLSSCSLALPWNAVW